MRKLLKIFFSQTSIVVLLMLVQIAAIAVMVFKLNQYSKIISLLFFIITFLAVIAVINSNKNPAYKMSWLIPMMIFPLFGGLMYIFINGQGLTRRFFHHVKKIEKSLCPDIEQDSAILDEIYRKSPARFNTVNYCARNDDVGYSAFKNTDVTYYPTGELCWKDMLTELEKAEKYIYLEYFIIEPGEMWNSIFEILKRKAAQGVDVRVLYDGVGSLVQMPKKCSREICAAGIKCRAFIPLVPFLSTMQNNRDHRKIMAIDGKVAFNGGINLADEYINKKVVYGRWKDTAVRLTGDGAYSFAVMFLQMWLATERKTPELPDIKPDWNYKAKTEGYIMPFSDTPNDDYQVGEFVYLEIVNKAKSYIHITTPYLILDNEMMTALVNAARSGIDVKIIIPGVADHWYAYYVAMDYAKELLSKGVKIYIYDPGFIHAKNFVSDDEVAVVGSINLDYRSLYLHFECATWMYASPAVEAVEEDFNETLKECHLLTDEELDSRSVIKRFVSAVLRIFAPLM